MHLLGPLLLSCDTRGGAAVSACCHRLRFSAAAVTDVVLECDLARRRREGHGEKLLEDREERVLGSIHRNMAVL